MSGSIAIPIAATSPGSSRTSRNHRLYDNYSLRPSRGLHPCISFSHSARAVATTRLLDEHAPRPRLQLISTGVSVWQRASALGKFAIMAAANINFITFNQDHSCIAVGTSRGFRIYHTDPFARVFTTEESNVSLIEMLFSTSLVALVISPRHLVIQNTKVRTTTPHTSPSLTLFVSPEVFGYMRAYLPLRHPCRSTEPPSLGHCTRRGHLYL